MKKRAKMRRLATCPRLSTQPWRLAAVFDPVYVVLEEMLREGTIHSVDNVTCFPLAQYGEWYQFTPALNGLAEMFELASKRKHWGISTAQITALTQKIDAGEMLNRDDVLACRDCLERIHRAAMTLTLDEAHDLLTTTQIGFELEAA